MTELEEKVYMAIGQASMCWSETPKGVFDDSQAKKIAEDLISYIASIAPARSWTFIEPIKACQCKPSHEATAILVPCGENCINATKSIN